MCNCQWLQYLFVPVDKHVAAYDTKTWNIAFELTDSSIKEVREFDQVLPAADYYNFL